MNSLNVTIGFSTTNKVASRLIRWAARAPCSHAWVAFYDSALGLRMVMQAEWRGFELRPWARWARENRLVAEYRVTGLQMAEPLRMLARELGGNYDFKSAFWVGLRSWLHRFFRTRFSLRPSRTPHQLMCSEAVTRLLTWAGAPFPQGLDPELISPGDLLKLVRSLPSFFDKVN